MVQTTVQSQSNQIYIMMARENLPKELSLEQIQIMRLPHKLVRNVVEKGKRHHNSCIVPISDWTRIYILTTLMSPLIHPIGDEKTQTSPWPSIVNYSIKPSWVQNQIHAQPIFVTPPATTNDDHHIFGTSIKLIPAFSFTETGIFSNLNLNLINHQLIKLVVRLEIWTEMASATLQQ